MKKDGSIRDEIKDRRFNRYHGTLITGIECDQKKYMVERVWNGYLIRFVQIFGYEFVCLEDIRDAKGPHCHDTAEKKNRVIRINGNNRYIDIKDFDSHEYYPNVHKRPEGKVWFDWVASGCEGSPIVRTGLINFWEKHSNIKKPEHVLANTTELFTILTSALQIAESVSIRKELLHLMLKIVKTIEKGGDEKINTEVAKELSVKLSSPKTEERNHMTCQEFAIDIKIYGELNNIYPKVGEMKKMFWSFLGKLMTRETQARGLPIVDVPVSPAKLKGWKYDGTTIGSYPIAVLADVFTREFKNAGDLIKANK